MLGAQPSCDPILHLGGGEGGVLNKSFILGGSAPKSDPLPFHVPFWQKRYPFYIPFIEKSCPFHIPILGSLVLVSCSA